MKLGLLTAPFPDTDLLDVADWTASIGLEAIEIACWPAASADARRYTGTSHIDVDDLSRSRAGEITAALSARGIAVSALGYYPNPLHPDAGHRQEVIKHLKKVITAAGTMNVRIVNTFVGGDKSLNVDENWERAVRIFPEIVAHARNNGVTLAFENCPMMFSYDEWPGGITLPIHRVSGAVSLKSISSYDYEDHVTVQTRDRPEPIIVPADPLPVGQRNAIEYVVGCIERAEPVTGPLDPELCLTAQRIIDTAVLSARQKRTLDLLP